MENSDVAGKRAPDRNDDLTYTLTYKDVVDILEIIDNSVSKELILEVGDLKLNLSKR
jgi:hypothetical protein